MWLLYDIAYLFALLAVSPLWIYRLVSTGKWRTDWPARFGRCGLDTSDDRPTLLIHAVSVGEVNAIRLLVEELEKQTAGRWRIVVSSTTDTGLAQATKLFEPRHAVVRYPLDFSFAVHRFLDAVNPDAMALVELEVWPNFVKECARRNIPVCVVNGRLSERSFRRYRIVARPLRRTFAQLAAVAVQTQAYADRFITLGVPPERVELLDSMKWDTAQVEDPREVSGVDLLAKAMGIDRGKPLIVAGSIAPGEDKLLADTCPTEAQLMLVPRKPEWFDKTAGAVPGIIRRTRCPDGRTRPIDGKRLFMLDTIGELRKAYALADVVIVGRSFLGNLYGSDMIEPIALSKPTVIGPHHNDFADVMDAFKTADGIVVTDQPGQAAGDLLADRAKAAAMARRGREVILSRQGATIRHTALLRRLMPADKPGA